MGRNYSTIVDNRVKFWKWVRNKGLMFKLLINFENIKTLK